jgi:hypothetical protein
MPITAISLSLGCFTGVVFGITIVSVAGRVSVVTMVLAAGGAFATTGVSAPWE